MNSRLVPVEMLHKGLDAALVKKFLALGSPLVGKADL